MTTIIEVKINSPEDMVAFGEAIKASSLEYMNCSSNYGYSSVTYDCNRKDMMNIKNYWRSIFKNCRVVSY